MRDAHGSRRATTRRLVGALALTFLGGLAWTPAALATAAPVAAWALDGDATEASHGSLDGTLLGGSWVAGHTGLALALATATDGVLVAGAAALQPSVLSLEARIRAAGPQAAGAALVAQGLATCDGPAFGLRVGPTGGIEFVLVDADATAASPEAPASTWDGAWHHLAGTFDGSSVRLFVDGVEVGAGTAAAGTSPGYAGGLDAEFRIGARLPAVGACGAGPAFAGSIDDVRLWDRPLSPAEVAARNGGTTVATTTVLGLPPAMQVGTPTTVSAAVVPAPVGGSVDFVDVTSPADDEVLATAPVTDGVAVAQIRFPLLGTRRVEARYGGAATFGASTSAAGGVTVERYLVAPGEARLGSHAFNGPITAALRDPATGVTYVGGDFTEIGHRTGPVAEVEPPGEGPGALVEGSPEVVGTVNASAADGDGYVLFGDLVAVNGEAVPIVSGAPAPIVRIDAANHRDPGWNVSAKSLACTQYGGVDQTWLNDVETFGHYLVVPFPRIRVDTNLGASSTGLGLLDLTSGTIYLTGQGTRTAPDGSPCSRLWASIPPLPQVAGCSQCFADIGAVSLDTTSGVLLVTYNFHKGQGASIQHSLVLAGYDTASGTRRWSRQIVGANPSSGEAWVSSAAPLPGAFLLTGAFPIETTPITWPQMTTTMTVDALTGATRQRWTTLGEVSLADPLGPTIADATLCLPTYANGVAGQASITSALLAGLGRIEASDATTTTFAVCTYGLDGGGKVVADDVGSGVLPQPNGPSSGWPVWAWHGDDTTYLVGPNLAFDLETGQQAAWSADPSNWAAGGTSVLQVGDRMVLTGPFRFLHGIEARHLAAIDPSQEPLAGFAGSLGTPADPFGAVTALALWSGRLVVAGMFDRLGGAARDGLGAIDPATGAADPWAPDAGGQSHPAVRSVAVDPAGGDLYVAGSSCSNAWWECPDVTVGPLVRYDPIDGGGAIDPSFAPTFACNPDGNTNNGVSPCPNVRVGVVRVLAGDVFVGGEFSGVNGSPRQGLARLGTNGTLRSWAPPLFTQMDAPETGELFAVDPREILLDGGRVLVAGRFEVWQPFGTTGAGIAYQRSPLIAWSESNSARIYPMPSVDLTGPLEGNGDGGYDVAIYGSAIVVAVGRRGAIVMDRTIFKIDKTANPYLVDKWWANTEGVFALADDPAAVAVAPSIASVPGMTSLQRQVLAQTAAATEPIVVTMAGAIPRWGLHTAGDLLEVGLRAPDALKPVAFAPRVTPGASSAVTAVAQPVAVTWPPAVETGSGMSRYELGLSTDGGGWKLITLSNPLAESAAAKLAVGHVYRFRVRAVDRAGNGSPWVYGVSFSLGYTGEGSSAVTYAGGTWTTRSLAGAVGGSVRSTTSKGAVARLTFTGRAIGVVMATGPARGTVSITIDGVFAGTASLHGTALRPARVVFSRFLGPGTHTVQVKALGTARVDLDGFTIVR